MTNKKTKKVLWSLGIGAVLAIVSTYGLNVILTEATSLGTSKLLGFRSLSILSAEFIILTLVLGATIKSIFFD